MYFLAILFGIHFLILVGMFDIYFQTPIISDINLVENNIGPLATRVALFIGDGIRFDMLFKNFTFPLTPYLKSQILNGAPWGISHSRVPTETRPGHVAIAAGFYEDPSAVFKGWTKNPVPFDSVFNQSNVTFSWGSPDVVPLFSYGNVPNIIWESYKEEDQVLSENSKPAFFVNNWVYDRFEEKLENPEDDITLLDKLTQSGLIFFFHFLGPDLVGHVSKPNSYFYEEAIRNTDLNIHKIIDLIELFYGDNSTAFIFTSDHGMTDWGTHGAGSEMEINTPFIAWGAGIKQSPCNFNSLLNCMQNISQADIAILISLVLGRPIPVNSIGVVPLDYLDLDEQGKCAAMLLNAKQLLNQFNKKEADVKSSIMSVFFVPFAELYKSVQAYRLNKVNNLIDKGLYKDAVEHCRLIIKDALRGITYYHRYFQNIKLFLMAMTFLGLIALILSETVPFFLPASIDHRTFTFLTSSTSIVQFLDIYYKWFILMGILEIIFAVSSCLPPMFSLYIIVPLFVWFYACRHEYWIYRSIQGMLSKWVFFKVVLYCIGVQLILLSFFSRWMISLVMIPIMMWPYKNSKLDSVGFMIKFVWAVSCLTLAIFPFLPTVAESKPNLLFVLLSTFSWLIIACVWLIVVNFKIMNLPTEFDIWFKSIFGFLLMYNIAYIDTILRTGAGLPLFNQIISHLFLVYYWIGLFYGPNEVLTRFISMSMSLGIIFMLFCSSHEGFFPIILCVNLTIWIYFEMAIISIRQKFFLSEITHSMIVRTVMTKDDIRRSFFYLYYIFLSFFGIGNVDSLNSFEFAWVKAFVSKFSPFLMTAWILFKTILPFIMVSSAIRIIVFITQTNIRRLFLIVLLFCEILGLQFLFFVKNEGSWLEIGRSISHFVIVQAATLILLALYLLTNYMIKPRSLVRLPY